MSNPLGESGFARVGLALLLAAAAFGPSGQAASAATLIVVQPDGGAIVRPEGGEPHSIPARCISALEQRLTGAADPALVQEAVADIVAEWAPHDGLLAGAIAAYALTLVPQELSAAVIAGAQQGNPDASEEIIVAAGPAPDSGAGGGLAPLSSVGGVGGAGTQELVRSASEIR